MFNSSSSFDYATPSYNAEAMVLLHIGALALAASLSGASAPLPAQTVTPVPRPFPSAGAPQTPPPATPTPAPKAAAATAAPAVPIYPAAEFLETFDAGKSQQFQLYGTDAPFADIVAYYKTTLKSGGRVLFQAPLMHQFDLGRFNEETMAYPPSVVIKDYTWNGSEGYLHVSGTTTRRYRTIIQIVPVPAR